MTIIGSKVKTISVVWATTYTDHLVKLPIGSIGIIEYISKDTVRPHSVISFPNNLQARIAPWVYEVI